MIIRSARTTRTVRSAAAFAAGGPNPEPAREHPQPPAGTWQDAQFAVRAVVVHAPQRWSGGTVCRNDAAPYPCQLHRWGRQVLGLHGLGPAEIDALIERGDPTAVPGTSGRPGVAPGTSNRPGA